MTLLPRPRPPAPLLPGRLVSDTKSLGHNFNAWAGPFAGDRPVHTITVYRVLPDSVPNVLGILLNEGREFRYEEDLALFVRTVEDRKTYKVVEILLDYMVPILRKIRKDGEIETKQDRIRTVTEIKLALFHETRRGGATEDVVAVLARKSVAELLANAINKIVGKTALKKLRLNLTHGTYLSLSNLFDDAAEITRASTQHLRGRSTYGALAQRAVPTARIECLAARLGNTWFLIFPDGVITTYQRLPDNDLTEKIGNALKHFLQFTPSF